MDTTTDSVNKKRVTIHTIAKKLDISSTTVYRALNDKSRISQKTKELVLEAVRELGFKPNTVAKSLARKSMRIAFVASSGFPEFHRYFVDGARQTEDELRDYNVHVDYYVDEQQHPPDGGILFLKNSVNRVLDGAYDGLLYLGSEVKELELVVERGIYIGSLVDDVLVSRRCFYQHYDGETAGRLAAELLYWKFGKGGKVALASGFTHKSIHSQMTRGFTENCRELMLDLTDILYNEDRENLAYTNTNALLDMRPGIQGMYINSYNSAGVIRSIREHGLAGKIILITSDINDELRAGLLDGTVSATIFQNQYRQGRLGLRFLYQCICGETTMEDTVSVNPEVIFKSNVNRYQEGS